MNRERLDELSAAVDAARAALRAEMERQFPVGTVVEWRYTRDRKHRGLVAGHKCIRDRVWLILALPSGIHVDCPWSSITRVVSRPEVGDDEQ